MVLAGGGGDRAEYAADLRKDAALLAGGPRERALVGGVVRGQRRRRGDVARVAPGRFTDSRTRALNQRSRLPPPGTPAAPCVTPGLAGALRVVSRSRRRDVSLGRRAGLRGGARAV